MYFYPSDRAILLAALENTGKVKNFVFRVKKKDGNVIYVSTNSHYYRDQSGTIAGIEGIIWDIKGQKKAT